MRAADERPKRSDQLPEDGPESVVPDDVPAGDPQSAEDELQAPGPRVDDDHPSPAAA